MCSQKAILQELLIGIGPDVITIKYETIFCDPNDIKSQVLINRLTPNFVCLFNWCFFITPHSPWTFQNTLLLKLKTNFRFRQSYVYEFLFIFLGRVILTYFVMTNLFNFCFRWTTKLEPFFSTLTNKLTNCFILNYFTQFF